AANPVGPNPSSLVSGDFNRDGLPDLALVNPGSTTISVLLGTGGGTFAPPVRIDVGGTPAAVAATDLNSDGRLDLAVIHKIPDGTWVVSTLLGNGDGTFRVPTGAFPVGPDPHGLVAGDFNGDGNTDLATANTSAGTVSVLLGTGDGDFA